MQVHSDSVILTISNIDKFVKSPKYRTFVIPVKACPRMY